MNLDLVVEKRKHRATAMLPEKNIHTEPSPLHMSHLPWGCVPAGHQPKGSQVWRQEGHSPRNRNKRARQSPQHTRGQLLAQLCLPDHDSSTGAG